MFSRFMRPNVSVPKPGDVVHVTARNISDANGSITAARCPVAVALRERYSLPLGYGLCAISYVVVDGEHFDTDSVLQDWVRRYDQTKVATPFSFKLGRKI